MAAIRMENIKKVYDKTNTVIDHLDLQIKDGSFTVLVGPSGCGKTTALRMIAGLEEVTEGRIYIDDADVTQKEPGERDVAMVFQNYAIYPHMTVRKNIEFGLENAKIEKEERERIIQSVVKQVGLEEYLNTKPGKLSGGQRQRVALARAISKKPKVFLMDEPLSNLDAKLRNQMRRELITLHKQMNRTFVYVTHDQIEAMTMGDNIIIMRDGKVMQQGNPQEIYSNPDNVFTAQFLGDPGMNVYPMENNNFIGIRPRKFLPYPPKCDCISIRSHIVTREILGSEVLYCAQSAIGNILFKTSENDFSVDESIRLYAAHKDVHFFDSQEQRIRDVHQIQTLIKQVVWI